MESFKEADIAGNIPEDKTKGMKASESPKENISGNEPVDFEELSEKESEKSKEDDRSAEEIRERIEHMKSGEDYGDHDVAELMKVPERISQRERVERVEGSGSFDEKFELLKELKEGEFKFEIEGFINNLSQILVDLSLTKEKREGFVTHIVEAIGKALEEGRLPEDFFEGINHMISIGSGHGENPYEILKKYMPEDSKALLIDPYAAPSGEIAEDESIQHLGQEFENVKIEVGDGEKNIVEASNFLQLYEEENKIEMIKKMIRLAGVGGKIIIVDEINREKLTERITDKVLNKIYNPGQNKYECMDSGDYEEMFKALRLKCFTSCESDRYDRGSVLFMLEVTQEAMDIATENSVRETESNQDEIFAHK